MVAWRARFPFTFVVMLGDNIYGTSTPHDYELKFERPYRALLDAGVEFRAAIGNHDDSAQIHYAKFNMNGRRYYTYRESERRLAGIAGAGVRFFVLDSRSLDPDQLAWLRAAAEGVRHGVEDLLLPPSALHVRPLPRRRPRAADRARADPRRGRRRRGARGPRAPVRTPPASAWHQLLHVGRRRIAAARRSGAFDRARQGVRYRLSLHADGGVGQRALFPGHQPDRADGGMPGGFRGRGRKGSRHPAPGRGFWACSRRLSTIPLRGSTTDQTTRRDDVKTRPNIDGSSLRTPREARAAGTVTKRRIHCSTSCRRLRQGNPDRSS